MKEGQKANKISEFMSAYLQYVFTIRNYFFDGQAINTNFSPKKYLESLRIPEKYIQKTYTTQNDLNKPLLEGIQNVHLIPLKADEDQWFSGAWHILLPNLISIFSLCYPVKNPSAELRRQETQSVFLLYAALSNDPIIKKNVSLQSLPSLRSIITLIEETYFSDFDNKVDVLNRVQNTFEKMKPLINLHIMCKIGEEKLNELNYSSHSKKIENTKLLFENIQPFVFSLIQNTFHETLSNPKGNFSFCTVDIINEQNSVLFDCITDDTIKSFQDFLYQTNSQNSYFGNTLVALATAMKNKDKNAIFNILNLSRNEDDLSKFLLEKEQFDPNISEKLEGKEPEKLEERKPPIRSTPTISPTEEHIDLLIIELTDRYGISQDKARLLAKNSINFAEGTFSESDRKLFDRIESGFRRGLDIDDVIAEQLKEITTPLPKKR